MRLDTVLKNFLKENKELLKQPDGGLNELYKKAMVKLPYQVQGGVGSLTRILYESGIDVLSYMTEVPENFTYDASRYMDIITIPGNIIHINANAFNRLWWHEYTIPSNVSSIGIKAFCEAFTEKINLSNGLKVISFMAFARSEIEEIKIPDTVIDIDDKAFYDCFKLKKITIGSNVQSLRQYQFAGCIYLEDATYNGTIEQFSSICNETTFKDCSRLMSVKCSDGEYVLKNG